MDRSNDASSMAAGLSAAAGPGGRTASLRARRARPFVVMEVLAAANRLEAQGLDILHLEIGEPGHGAPKAAIEAARRALEGPLGYTDAAGLASLRQGIAALYRAWHGITVEPERIVVTAGASAGFILAFLAAFDPGQRVAVPMPAYPAYTTILESLGVEVVPIETGPETRFQPTPLLLDRAGPLDGVILASPANPTGTMLLPAELRALAAWADARGARLIVDEIYHGLSFDAPADTILSHCRQSVVVNSFSKYFAMTGWRLGWLVLPEPLVGPVTRLGQNLFIAAPTIAQHAAVGALGACAELDGRSHAYKASRDLLLAALHRAGITRTAPADGAFYVWADIAHLGIDSVTLAKRLLAETGIAVTPGVDFDPRRGHDFIRLSFAGAPARVEAAAAGLEAWLASV